jgi:F-type H+-transporting ATPase subunit epsilon
VKTFHLEIASPDGMRFSGDAEQISVYSIDGSLSILAGHVPYATALAKGECRVYVDGKIRHAEVSGGFLTVTPEAVRLLSADFTWK